MLLKLTNLTTNGLLFEFSFILSIWSILSGISTIIVKNTIVSILFLILLFATMGAFLCHLGLEFLGYSYILIYVGAVSILFLFILMLVNLRRSELLSNNVKILALAGLIIFFGVFISFSVYLNSQVNKTKSLVNNLKAYLKLFLNWLLPESNGNGDDAGVSVGLEGGSVWRLFVYFFLVEYVMSISWDGLYTILSHISGIGVIMYTTSCVLLLIVSLILVLTMTGSIVVTVSSDTSY